LPIWPRAEIGAEGVGLDPLIALHNDGADGWRLSIGRACGERHDATTQYTSPEDKAGEAKPSNKPLTKFHPPRALCRSPLGTPQTWYRTRKVVPTPQRTYEPRRSYRHPHLLRNPALPLYPRKVAVSLRRRPLGGEMEKVVVRRKDHQHDNDREPDPESHFLSALR
jgi:hypothetical protein